MAPVKSREGCGNSRRAGHSGSGFLLGLVIIFRWTGSRILRVRVAKKGRISAQIAYRANPELPRKLGFSKLSV